MTAPALSVSGVVKRFGGHIAVDGISFEVPRGVVYGVLGPNGAGKSTTLRMINDIIAPDAGQIRILDGLPPGNEAGKQIGYLPEERGLYPKMRVLDMVVFMGELRGLSHGESKKRARTWLERLGLGKWLEFKVQALSKGMQQKVQFATALIHEPPLVILDEPWSGLDPINAEVLRETVDEIRSQGRTVLFSTHQMEQAEKICDSVCIIAHGKKVLEGKLRDIKRDEIADGTIALAFADDKSKELASGPLADTKLVTDRRAPRAGTHADCEIVLADGVTPHQLLATLLNHDVNLRLFEVVVPTLHQIFVHRVGASAAVAERRDEEADRA